MHHERRREPRHVVVGLEACLDAVPCTIVDVSRSAVRLLKPEGFIVGHEPVNIIFRLSESMHGQRRSFRVIGHLVRSTDIEIIYHYTPPTSRWEFLLHALDTFAQTQLTRL